MKANEIRELSDHELDSKIGELSESLLTFRFQHKIGQLENPNRLKQMKREIARIKTIKRQRERLG